MNFIKTTYYSLLITFFRLISGFAVNKILAIFIGPSGFALFTSFRNFMSITISICGGSINAGLLKYSAEFNFNKKKSMLLYSTAIKMSITLSLIFSILLLFLAKSISKFLFNNYDFILPIRLLGLLIPLIVFNGIFLTILNGRGQIKQYTLINIAGSIINFCTLFIFIFFFSLTGAMLSVILVQFIISAISLFFIIKSHWFSFEYFLKPFRNSIAKKLIYFSLVFLAQQTIPQFTNLIIQNSIIELTGLESAGLWRSILKISDGFITAIIGLFSLYYLPKISSVKKEELIDVFFEFLKWLVFVSIILGSLILVFRFQIIVFLFNEKFYNMEPLFLWQIFGSCFKIVGWLISSTLLYKNHLFVFLITEIICFCALIFLSNMFIKYYGLIGTTYSYAVTYFLNLLLMVYFFRNLILKPSSIKNHF